MGQNIGQYSIYASKKINDIEVFAFEPSVFNLEILVARNIFLNNPENITIVPIPFSKKLNSDFFLLLILTGVELYQVIQPL